jgi:hypothetical protein
MLEFAHIAIVVSPRLRGTFKQSIHRSHCPMGKKQRIKMEKDVFKSVGRITMSGQKAVRFWIRVLDVEKEVDDATAQIREKLSADMKGTIPIVGEYKVDDNFEFIYLIVIDLDALGVTGGLGIIYYTDPERRVEVLKSRDRLAESIFDALRKRPSMALEFRVMEQKKHE